MKNYYELLQVAKNAEPEVIDAAYRRLARKYHPDHNISIDANTRMQDINEAYDVLKDPQKREKYNCEFFLFFKDKNIDSREVNIERNKREQAEKKERDAKYQTEFERRKREEAEEKERNAKDQAKIERQKREEAEEIIASLTEKNVHKKAIKYGIAISAASLLFVTFFGIIMFWVRNDNSNRIEGPIDYSNKTTVHPTNQTATTKPDITDEYLINMSGLLKKYEQCINSIQTITNSPRALTVFMDDSLFTEEFLPLVDEVQSLQETMDNLKPPQKYTELHQEIIGVLYHFTHAMSLFEDWSRTRSDDTLLDKATDEINTFNQELNNIGSIANFITNFNTEP